MDTQQVITDQGTNTKYDIEYLFKIASENHVPVLRMFLTSSMAGVPFNALLEFKRIMDAIYLKTSDKLGNKKELVDRTKRWLNKYNYNITKNIIDDAREGIAIFELYKTELFRINILKVG